jgi:hypothetical protein
VLPDGVGRDAEPLRQVFDRKASLVPQEHGKQLLLSKPDAVDPGLSG